MADEHGNPAPSAIPGLADLILAAPRTPGSVEAGQLDALREDFPAFRIWRESIGDRVQYVARRHHPGAHPHTVVTTNPGELRAALQHAPGNHPGGWAEWEPHQ